MRTTEGIDEDLGGGQEVDESLDLLMLREERRDERHDRDNLEAEIVHLMDVLGHERAGPRVRTRRPRMDEFTCPGCHLVLHRTQLARGASGLCKDCSG